MNHYTPCQILYWYDDIVVFLFLRNVKAFRFFWSLFRCGVVLVVVYEMSVGCIFVLARSQGGHWRPYRKGCILLLFRYSIESWVLRTVQALTKIFWFISGSLVHQQSLTQKRWGGGSNLLISFLLLWLSNRVLHSCRSLVVALLIPGRSLWEDSLHQLTLLLDGNGHLFWRHGSVLVARRAANISNLAAEGHSCGNTKFKVEVLVSLCVHILFAYNGIGEGCLHMSRFFRCSESEWRNLVSSVQLYCSIWLFVYRRLEVVLTSSNNRKWNKVVKI